MAEEWEKLQACVTGFPGVSVDPSWFDEDGDHTMASIVCSACPVTQQCHDRLVAEVAAGKRVNGFYAGRYWTNRFREERGKKISMLCGNRLCENTFTGYPAGRKRFCSARCGDRARYNPSFLRQPDAAPEMGP